MTLLQADNLSWRSHNRTRVEQLSLSINAGELVGIIGPNGAGKSSLLQLLAALQRPDTGKVLLGGADLALQTPRWRARHIGYLEQRPSVHWPFSVQQVVALARLPHGDRDNSSGAAAVAQALHDCGMEQYGTRVFAELSEGEKMRVHLARLLAGQAQVLLADEPTASLDLVRQHAVLTLLKQQARAGAAVIVTLHDLTAAALHCDRLLLLHGGRMLAVGTAMEVLTPALLAQAFGLDMQVDVAAGTITIHRYQGE